jgi:ribonuclease J
LITVKLKEARALNSAVINVVEPGGSFTAGCFKVEFFPVCHSIPDAVGLIIETPVGLLVHTGDFKLDYTPVYGEPTNLSRLAQAGARGVLALLSDSTHAERPGYTPSEKVIGEALDSIISRAPGRVIVATFASLISRLQQVIDAAAKHGRKVFVFGRSMSDNVKMALELGYLKVLPDVLAKPDELKGLPPEKIVMVATGSQGEPTSALVRIANHSHRQVSINKGDTVVVSASPIPGNESLVNRTIDSLFKQGAEVFYDQLSQVHVHGHASQEELKLVLNLVKPRLFVPIHGEFRHLTLHARLAEDAGVESKDIFRLEDGDVLEISSTAGRVTGKVTSGHVYVDGLSVGDVGGVVLRNRRMLSRDGIVVVIVAVSQQTGKLVNRPDIVSRGFVDTVESKDMIEEGKDLVARIIDHSGKRDADISSADTRVRDELNRFFFEKTKRRPMILPVLVKV